MQASRPCARGASACFVVVYYKDTKNITHIQEITDISSGDYKVFQTKKHSTHFPRTLARMGVVGRVNKYPYWILLYGAHNCGFESLDIRGTIKSSKSKIVFYFLHVIINTRSTLIGVRVNVGSFGFLLFAFWFLRVL